MKPLLATMPRYHSKDLPVMVACMLPVAVLLNYVLYGSRLFADAGMFLGTLAATFISLVVFFNACGFVAVQLRNRFPTEEELVKRILICLAIFYLLSALYISTLLFIYDATSLSGYHYDETHFYYAFLAAVVINTFITFLMEAIYRFEQLKETAGQTESLRREYMQSKLLGLKSQVNPHFLFNSLNTLSSLIHEDGDKAELFLNQMSKVYRYLLRYRDEPLVALETEMAFIHSYAYLLKQRHGEGIELNIHIPREVMDMMIAPLTLQVIIENAVNGNSISKTCPLVITIEAGGDKLAVRHSVQCRVNAPEDYTALENMIHKYELLCGVTVMVQEDKAHRVISIPLIPNNQTAAIL